MTNAQRYTLEASRLREQINNELSAETPDDEKLATIQTEFRAVEKRRRIAIEAEGEGETTPTTPDSELRERIELRSKASLGRFLLSALKGRIVQGAEAELMDAAGIDDGIPLELFDTQPETEERAVTGAPGTVGVNLDRIRPAVFAPSILPRLGVEMPRVQSGTYASATISTSTTADAVAKGANVPATAAEFTVKNRDTEEGVRDARAGARGHCGGRAGQFRERPA